MSTDTNDGGPAFPSTETVNFYECKFEDGRKTESVVAFNGGQGLTIRDFFACHAMGNMFVRNRARALIQSEDEIARSAYAFADAMLKARK